MGTSPDDGNGMLACTVGILRPFILVSSEIRASLSSDEFDVVLAHEKAHIAARDNLSLLVAHAVRSALFFFPGIRETHRGVRRSMELAADAYATKQTGDRLLVAGSLSRVAGLMFESTGARHGAPLPTVASFGHEELVVERVRRLVLDREPPCSRRRILCAAGALLLVFAILGSSLFAVSGDNVTRSTGTTICCADADTHAM